MDPATTDAYPTFFDRSTPARRHLGRRGWIAGALSFLLCGLGQLYAGRWRQALAFFLADLLVFLACLLAFLHVRIEPLNLYLPLSAYLAYRVWVIVNAVRTARRAKGFRWRWFPRWFAYVTLFGCYSYFGSYHFALLIRDHVAEPFRMTTRSMADTLLPGDRFFVDKLFYSDSARFDVVVYKWTDSEGTERTFVDRIIGRPGERVEVKGNAAYVDGDRLQEPYLRLHGWEGVDFGPALVPPNSYFLLGDLRDKSRDSRDPAIGFVSRNQIVGLVLTITDSTDPESGDFRWKRIGTVIR